MPFQTFIDWLQDSPSFYSHLCQCVCILREPGSGRHLSRYLWLNMYTAILNSSEQWGQVPLWCLTYYKACCQWTQYVECFSLAFSLMSAAAIHPNQYLLQILRIYKIHILACVLHTPITWMHISFLWSNAGLHLCLIRKPIMVSCTLTVHPGMFTAS